MRSPSPDIGAARTIQGLIPSYTLLNSRQLVRIGEILAAMNVGGRP